MSRFILLLTSVLVLASCSVIPSAKKIYFVDFSSFEEKGLFVTPSMDAPYEYTTMGKVIIDLISGYDYDKEEEIRYTPKEAIEELSKQLQELGADGCIGLTYIATPQDKGDGFINPRLQVYNITISGYAIKKK